MKLKALLRGDVRFQYKYGFYFLYLLLSVLYVAVLFFAARGLAAKSGAADDFFRPRRDGALFYGRHRAV